MHVANTVTGLHAGLQHTPRLLLGHARPVVEHLEYEGVLSPVEPDHDVQRMIVVPYRMVDRVLDERLQHELQRLMRIEGFIDLPPQAKQVLEAHLLDGDVKAGNFQLLLNENVPLAFIQ